MSDSKSLTINSKNLAIWLTIAGIAIGSIVDSALTRDQVRRNTAELEKHNLDIIEYKLEHIEGTVTKIDAKVDQVVTLVKNYINQE